MVNFVGGSCTEAARDDVGNNGKFFQVGSPDDNLSMSRGHSVDLSPKTKPVHFVAVQAVVI